KKDMRLCGAKPKPGYASCHIHVMVDSINHPLTAGIPQGYGPKDLRTAYNLNDRTSGKKIVAIVDAYDNPTIKNDLDTYSNYFGLPKLPACSGDIAKS